MIQSKYPIIHILGATGSGKTTLGKKIKQNYKSQVHVLDTDDIDDYSVLDMLHSKSYDNLLTDDSINTFFEIKNKLNSALQKHMKMHAFSMFFRAFLGQRPKNFPYEIWKSTSENHTFTCGFGVPNLCLKSSTKLRKF